MNFDASKKTVAQFVIRNMPTGTITTQKDLVLSTILEPRASVMAVARGMVRVAQHLHGFTIGYENNTAVVAIRANKYG